MRVVTLFLISFLLLSLTDRTSEADSSTIEKTSVLPKFFNPTLNQLTTLFAAVSGAQDLRLQILSHDARIIRTLVKKDKTDNGELSFSWDGRNDSGQIAENGLYFFKIEQLTENGKRTLSQGKLSDTQFSVQPTYYDRENGILNYRLPGASLVLIQARTFNTDPLTRLKTYSVLKTIANWEPRVEGSIIESWDGWDLAGKQYVPGLPNSHISIECRSIQGPFVITVGKPSKQQLKVSEKGL